MKDTVRALAAAGALLLPGLAPADDSDLTISGNVGLFSQYVFRSIAQTNEDPALQGGLDVGHKSGLYAGLWGSNISWISDFGSSDGGNSLELDFYGGYRNSFGDSDFGYDVGVLYYWYPGDTLDSFDPDTTELYAGLSWKWAGVKLSYSLSDYFGYEGDTGSNDSDGTTYYDLYANIPVADTGLTVNLHYGYLDVSHDQSSPEELSYGDWKVGISYALPQDFTVGLYGTGNDADAGFYTTPSGKNTADNQFVVFLTKTL